MPTRFIVKHTNARYLWGRSTWLKGRLRRRIRHSELARWREMCEMLREWEPSLSSAYLSYMGRIAYRTRRYTKRGL